MSEKTRFDRWLERLSYMAQVGLFFVTLLTIYFTVIPLYQNASLQESIALKEKQLKELKVSLVKYYRANREQVVRDFISHAALKCTSLLKLVPPPSPYFIENTSDDYKMNVIDKDINSCINNKDTLHKVMSQLNNADVLLFDKYLSVTNYHINGFKNEYAVKFNDFIRGVNSGEVVFPSGSILSEEVVLDMKYTDGSNNDSIRHSRINKILNEIEWEFEDKVRGEVYKLRDIKWSEEKE